MQAVQLDQLLPQLQTVQTSPQELKTGDTTFIDSLRAMQQEQEVDTNNEVAYTKAEEKTEVRPSATASENNESETEIIEYQYAAMANLVQETEQISEAAQIDFNIQELPEITEAQTPETLTEKQVQWLLTPVTKAAVEDSVSDEDFAALIEAAVEFIPGEITEEEKLEQSQNLAVNDPKMFLEKNTEVVSVADTSIKTQENPAQTKLFDSKEKVKTVKDEKKEVRFEVTDLRTAKIDEKSAEIAVNKTESRKDFNLTYKRESANSVQVTMDISQNISQNITSSSSQTAAADGSTFQSMLANAVQENAPDFVKAGSIVLKDNNQGNINLILHPEKLGNIKINLSLNDKMISGSITVNSKEAYEAMRESIAALKNEFAHSGFETGEFNLNFNDNSQQFAQNSNQHGQNQQAAFRAERSYGDYVAAEAAVSAEIEDAYMNASNISVNIVA